MYMYVHVCATRTCKDSVLCGVCIICLCVYQARQSPRLQAHSQLFKNLGMGLGMRLARHSPHCM